MTKIKCNKKIAKKRVLCYKLVMKFLDQAKIYLQSGDGGAGSVSFRREAFVEHGGPNGGDGGRGGHVVFLCVKNLNTLIDFRYQQHFKAKKGDHGKGSSMSGKKGADLIIKVPVGTQIMDENNETVLIDMIREGQEVRFLKGGDGGFGNEKYKSSTNQAPRKKLDGFPGEEAWVWLRLKLIADAGLVGLPNAGKSTFLSVTTHAKPKIADYPFTTLVPNLGVVKIHDKEFVIADIPGLIEGASEGHGLGDRFLGHVERTNIILHLVDGVTEDVKADFETIRNELRLYGGDLDQKPYILALNKVDALTEDDIAEKQAILEKASGQKVELLSSATRVGVDNILNLMLHAISDGRKAEEQAILDAANNSKDEGADIDDQD